MNDTPIIRVQIDGIRKHLLHALTTEQGDIEKHIRQVFSQFNFEATVKEETRRLLPDMVREMVKGAIQNSMYTLQHELQPVVDEAVRKAAKNLNKAPCGCLTGCKSPTCDKV